ncbi:hypothetical protein Tco_0164315 [Tanacetum coccineum]
MTRLVPHNERYFLFALYFEDNNLPQLSSFYDTRLHESVEIAFVVKAHAVLDSRMSPSSAWLDDDTCWDLQRLGVVGVSTIQVRATMFTRFGGGSAWDLPGVLDDVNKCVEMNVS